MKQPLVHPKSGEDDKDLQKIMIRNVMLFILTILVSGLYAQNVSQNELDILTGDKWKGEITYLNDGDREVVTMPAELIVTKIKPGVYEFTYFYPDEPKANSSSRVKINSDGTKIAGKRIVKVEKKRDGSLLILADGKGGDNREAAWFYFTYSLSANSFSTKKEVEYKGSKEKFVRNEYHFSR